MADEEVFKYLKKFTFFFLYLCQTGQNGSFREASLWRESVIEQNSK